MIRATLKGTMLFAFGRLPGGPKLYRTLTRRMMGTQATHVDKLARVYPEYVEVWEKRLGLELEGASLWIHEGGWTMFPFFFGYALTGKGPTITNAEGQLQEQYTQHAIDALSTLPCLMRGERAERVRWIQTQSAADIPTWIERLGATYIADCDLAKIQLSDASITICHSGGTLEHYSASELANFILEMTRILQPGGVSSHIVDHRDHLYHADKQIPFLNHWHLSPRAYNFWYGHKLTYHNRLTTAQVRTSFAACGLREQLLRRLLLPDLRLVDRDEEALDGLLGLEMSRVNSAYDPSEADLHTAAGHYLFRKPG